MINKTRCAWVLHDADYIGYHDTEWGVPVFDSQQLFRALILEGIQAGLSWITVLKKRQAYDEIYHGFNPEYMAQLSADALNVQRQDPRLIRNRLKLAAAVTNAQAYLDLVSVHDFSDYLWTFVKHQPQQNDYENLADVPVQTEASCAMSAALKKAGFKFVGPTICYAFMQAVGMVNDHTINCFRHSELLQNSATN